MSKLDEHSLGDCEGLYGYLCEECRIWYQEQADEWQQQEDLDHDNKREGSEQ